MQRQLEPEIMETWEEAIDYDTMDFTELNIAFAQEAISYAGRNAIALGRIESGLVLDAGTGTGRIPVLMCQMRPKWQIIAVDLAKNMLQIASKHVQQAGLQEQIRLQLVDAKYLPYADEVFDLVISNSLVHHLPDPLPFFKELQRVTKRNGGIFIRDLFRPVDEVTMNALVETIGDKYNVHQKKLFRDSLQAALTINEVEQLISTAGLVGVEVYQSSDYHWTSERSWTE